MIFLNILYIFARRALSKGAQNFEPPISQITFDGREKRSEKLSVAEIPPKYLDLA